MRIGTRIGSVVGAVVVLVQLASRLPAAQEPRTILGGVFTEVQAKRGRTLYDMRCAGCHGADLDGGVSAPPLRGSDFEESWDGSPLMDLVERIRKTMPSDNPESLSRSQTVDLVTAILAGAGFPAGSAELSTGDDVLTHTLMRRSAR